MNIKNVPTLFSKFYSLVSHRVHSMTNALQHFYEWPVVFHKISTAPNFCRWQDNWCCIIPNQWSCSYQGVLYSSFNHEFIREIIVNYSFMVTRRHRKNLPQNVAWKLIIWLKMEKENCRLLTAKSRSAREASHHQAFIVSCLTVSQTCLPCQPSG